MRQLPVELSSIGRGIAPHAPADNIKSAPIWQNSGSVMALIRCTLPASKPYPPSLHPFHAPSLFVSPQFPPQFRRYTLSFSFTTRSPPSPPLSTYNSPRIVRSFLFFLLFSFFSPPSLSLSMKGISPIQHARYPLCVRPPPASESPCFYLFTIATNNGYHTSPWDWRERDEAALGFRWMWYFRFAADSFAISFPSFVFSSSLSLFFLVILFISDPSFLSFFYFWFFVWEELVDEFDCETNKIIV